MFNAFESLTPHHPVILIGTDCPVLTPLNLIKSANLLREGSDVVFLPTEDGGYALIGAAKAWSEIFADIRWGTDRVMAETRLGARALGLRTASRRSSGISTRPPIMTGPQPPVCSISHAPGGCRHLPPTRTEINFMRSGTTNLDSCICKPAAGMRSSVRWSKLAP